MAQKLEVLLLDQADVIKCGALDYAQTVEDEIKAYGMLDDGEAQDPICPQLWFNNEEAGNAFIAFHPCSLGRDVDIAGIKTIGRFPNNPGMKDLPCLIGLTELIDLRTGQPKALLDATLITVIRTGCSAAVGARYLARKDAKVVGALGCGAVGRAQIIALVKEMPGLEEVKIYDLFRDKAAAVGKELSEELRVNVHSVDTAEAAVRDSDIVAPATITTFGNGYIPPEWIKKGALLVNLSDNDYTEGAVKLCSRIVVDGHKQFGIPVTMGDLVKRGVIDVEKDTHTIGQVINGKAPGRQNDEEIIFYSPLGMGLHDVIIARRIYDKALASGVGKRWTVWDQPYFC